MKPNNIIIAIILTATTAACTSSIPITRTNNPDEYVVVARNMAAVFSSLQLAQEEAELRAMEHCEIMGKVFKKNYAIDRPMAVAQAPESTLYFTCIEKPRSN